MSAPHWYDVFSVEYGVDALGDEMVPESEYVNPNPATTVCGGCKKQAARIAELEAALREILAREDGWDWQGYEIKQTARRALEGGDA